MAIHTIEDIRYLREGSARIEMRGSIDLETLLQGLEKCGEILKESAKSRTRRVGDWVLKETKFDKGRGPLKLTLQRRRYRRAWDAALHLARHGVNVPAPLAFIEDIRWGIVTANTVVSEYLVGAENVEQYARKLVHLKASPEEISAFLSRLAEAVNALNKAGAYHGDLSGKNILTRDGTSFYFIDLDGVELDREYTNELRVKNHIQLYDSFCDLWDDEYLEPFVLAMLPAGYVPPTWMENVRKGQAHRRARIEAIWKKEQ